MLGDTIIAAASPIGRAERVVLRISGPKARAIARLSFTPELAPERAQIEGRLQVRGREVAAFALVMPGPRSFTGEDVVELHLPGSPLLLTLLREDLLERGAALGCRAAQPGEFTARACTNGRLDLLQAEGILLMLHAADRRELAAGAQWLRGGLSIAIGELRGQLQDVLALLEAGLDFTEGETGEVAGHEVAEPLAKIADAVQSLLAGLPVAVTGGEVMLLGAANAGKSSLCNALAGRSAVLVDSGSGTTRDLVRVELGDGAALWDTPGDLDDPSQWDAASLQLRDRLAGRAAAAIVVIDAMAPVVPQFAAQGPLPWLAVVLTKCDLAEKPQLPAQIQARIDNGLPLVETSAVDGRGLQELRELLGRSAQSGAADAGGPLREQLGSVAGAVERAHAVIEGGAELAAVELQVALRALDGSSGSHSPEDLLGRIYGRFCLGK